MHNLTWTSDIDIIICKANQRLGLMDMPLGAAAPYKSKRLPHNTMVRSVKLYAPVTWNLNKFDLQRLEVSKFMPQNILMTIHLIILQD